MILEGLVPQIIFSDIDGTVVHYEKDMHSQGYTLESTGVDSQGRETAVFSHVSGRNVRCLKVPSLTLGGGFISEATLSLVDVLRDEFGVYFVLMTGARTSTMLMRRASATLPKTEFDVCEGGGSMWRRQSCDDKQDVPHMVEWSRQFEPLCGPPQDEDAEFRQGALWDIYRTLIEDGFALDAKSFSTSFLVLVSESPRVKSGHMSVDEAQFYLRNRFGNTTDLGGKGFWYVTNLGKGQVICSGSGKHEAMKFILETLKIEHPKLSAIALFDDENDLEFAAMCGAGFLPSIAHEVVLPIVNKINDECGQIRFAPLDVEGPLATEQALGLIIQRCKQIPSK